MWEIVITRYKKDKCSQKSNDREEKITWTWNLIWIRYINMAIDSFLNIFYFNIKMKKVDFFNKIKSWAILISE